MGRSPRSVNASPLVTPICPHRHLGGAEFAARSHQPWQPVPSRHSAPGPRRTRTHGPRSARPRVPRHSGGHRHFGNRNEEPAVGDVVDGSQHTVTDQLAHQIAICGAPSRDRQAAARPLPPANLAQIHRLAKPACRIANKQGWASPAALNAKRHRSGEIVEQADAADRWGRQDRAPFVSL